MTKLALSLVLSVSIALSASAAAAAPMPPDPSQAQSQPPSLVPPAPVQAQLQLVPFPTDAKIGIVNLQTIFTNSAVGKQGRDRLKTLQDRLSAGLAARDKELQGLAEKIRTQEGLIAQTVLNGWNRELQRLQRETQFAQQEAQVQSEQMQQEILAEFEKQVVPTVEALRAEKGLWLVLTAQEPGGTPTILASLPALDLSAEVVKRLNSSK